MSASTAPAAKNTSYYIKALITIVIMFGFGQLPPIDPITPLGMNIVGIFIGLLFGWMTIGLIWPSILGCVALVLIGGMSVADVLAGGWGSTTQMLIFFMIVVAGIVEQSGVSRFIAMFLITRKWVLGKPWVFTFVFLGAAFLLAAVTSTIPTIIICWSIWYSICNQVGYKPYQPFPSFMVVGVVMAATFGLSVFPFRPVGILVFGILKDLSGLSVNYLTYTCFTLPLCLLCILVFTLLGKLVFHIDVSLLKNLTKDSFKDVDLSLNKQQKAILIFVALLIVLLLVPSVLPQTFFLAAILKKLDAVGTAMVLVAVMCALKVDGKPILNFKDVCSKGMQWDVLMLTAVVMPLSSVLTADETGVTDFLLNVLSPLFDGRSAITFLMIAVFSAVIITNFAVNNVVGAILLPVFYPFALQLGIAPLALASLLVFTCHFALLTPAASPMAALLHGNTQWCRTSDIYKYGFLIVISSMIVAWVAGIPYALFLFQ